MLLTKLEGVSVLFKEISREVNVIPLKNNEVDKILREDKNDTCRSD